MGPVGWGGVRSMVIFGLLRLRMPRSERQIIRPVLIGNHSHVLPDWEISRISTLLGCQQCGDRYKGGLPVVATHRDRTNPKPACNQACFLLMGLISR